MFNQKQTHIDQMMNYTQGSTIIKKANHIDNAKDRNRAKHVETIKVSDQFDTKQANHRQKLELVRLIFHEQAHTNLDNGNEIDSEIQRHRD